MTNTPSTYRCSILAYEVRSILKEQGYEIYDLSKKPFGLAYKRVNQFVASLSSLDHVHALTEPEICSITGPLKNERKARHRIYAALLALGVQKQMKNYLAEYTDGMSERDCERAWSVADEVRKAALAWIQRRLDAGDGRWRGSSNDSSDPAQESTIDALLDAQNEYEEGVLLASLGLEGLDPTNGQISFEYARCHLLHAQSLLDALPPSVRATAEWQELAQQVQEQLNVVEDELS